MEKRRTIEKKNAKKKVMRGTLTAVTIMTALFMLTVTAAADTAVSYGTGAIEVDNVKGNETTFKAFQIFKANKNPDGTVSNLQWYSTEVRNKVTAVLREFDTSYNSNNAQDAADAISKAYQNASGEMTTNQKSILSATEMLNKIASAVDDLTPAETLTAGKSKTLDEGYWLCVTDGATVGLNETGTSPIFTIVSGGVVKITEKTTPPVITKDVLNDADGAEWAKGAEAEIGQVVPYKVTGTIQSNYKTFTSYYYGMEDTMSKGLTYIEGSIKVDIDGHDATSSFKEKVAVNKDGSHTLTMTCNDLKKISYVNAKSLVTFTYDVKLNKDCIIGAEGNPNVVNLEYSSNPNTTEKTKTTKKKTYLYTFKMHLEKKDGDTNKALAGAKFTIEATNPDDKASKGKFVQADGTLADKAYEFTTDKKGVIEVKGLDAGEYTLHETKAPDKYQIVNKDTKFRIVATYNDDGSIRTLKNTVSGNADAAAGIDTVSDDSGDGTQRNTVKGDSGTAADVEACLVNVTVGNIEKIKMPLSGQEGITLIIAAGIGIVGISLAGLFIAKKKRDEA